MIAHEFSPVMTKGKALPNRDLGYSSIPLAAKLGLKDGQDVAFVALPDPLGWLAEARCFSSVLRVATPSDLRSPAGSVDLLHGFFMEATAMRAALPLFRGTLREAGSLWISWPKKSAKTASELSDEMVRRAALAIGLVDIKVCAVDTTWSGLKLVIPRDKRVHHSS
jgi:hypothetical protein